MTPDVLASSALNLTDHIKTYGGYAGFAAIIGLAVLTILYFAQAREVKRLREWAGRGPERAAEVGARAGADPAKRIVAEPLTRPDPVTAAAQAPPAIAAPATAAALGVAATGAEASDADKSAAEKTDGEKTDAGAVDAPAPAPVSDATSAGIPAEELSQASIAMAPVPASARARAAASPATPRRPRPGTPPPEEEHSPWRKRLLIGAGVVVAVIVIVFLATSVFGGDSSKPKTTAHHATTTGTPTAVTSGGVKTGSIKNAPPRSEIKVGVLNGTRVPGLAKATGLKLSGAGYTVPGESEKNASDQTHVATSVAYAAGQQSAALSVARTLGLGADALVKLDPDTNLVADSQQHLNLTVVVTVGADLKP